jgi:hypothetical protein
MLVNKFRNGILAIILEMLEGAGLILVKFLASRASTQARDSSDLVFTIGRSKGLSNQGNIKKHL